MTAYEDGHDGGGSAPKDARMWAMWCHLGGLAGYIGIPFGNILVPAVIWMLKKDSHPFVDQQGKEALNFQISMTIYAFVAALTLLIMIGIIILPILILAGVVLSIIAGIKANDGIAYRYPFTIRLFD